MLITAGLLDFVSQRGMQLESRSRSFRWEDFAHLGHVSNTTSGYHRDKAAVHVASVTPYRYIRCWLGVPLVIGKSHWDYSCRQTQQVIRKNAMQAACFRRLCRYYHRLSPPIDQTRARTDQKLRGYFFRFAPGWNPQAMLQFIVAKTVEALGGDAGALLQIDVTCWG